MPLRILNKHLSSEFTSVYKMSIPVSCLAVLIPEEYLLS